MAKKKVINYSDSRVWAVVFLFLAVSVVALYKNRLFQNSTYEPTITPDPNFSVPAKELDEGGIFTDITNGFTFSYPDETLISTPLQSSATGLSKSFSISNSQGEQTHWITYGVSSSSGSSNDYQNLRDLGIGKTLYDPNEYEKEPQEEWPLWNWVKQKNVTLNDYSGFMLYTYPTGGGTGTPSWGYSTTWKINDKTVTISINTANGKQELDRYKNVYQNIVNSFQIIDSSN